MAHGGTAIGEQEVRYVMSQIEEGNDEELKDLGQDCVCITSRGTPIRAKTLGQKTYVTAIEKNSIVFGIGPAGTGKTYLAVAMAVKAFKNKEFMAEPYLKAISDAYNKYRIYNISSRNAMLYLIDELLEF